MVDIHVQLAGFSRIDFEKNAIRKALRLEAKPVVGFARQFIAKRGRSAAGSYPGRDTGLLRRAIGATTLKGEFAVLVGPRRKVLAGKRNARDAAYPWMLVHGVRQGRRPGKLAPGQGIGKNNRRRKGERMALETARRRNGWRIAPRDDYMIEAMGRRRAAATEAIREALQRAMVPR